MAPADGLVPAADFRGVSKHFGSGPRVLEAFSGAFPRGAFVTFLGPSGCGKSTLLKLLAGLIEPSEGTLQVDGRTPREAREETFYVFQDANLMPWLRVRANVELPLKLRGEPRAQRAAVANRMLALVGLRGAAEHFPWELSGGMKMRVSIARALSVRPRLLLLDEPFGAVDEMTRNRLNEDLLRLREEDPFTAFFVTHSVAEAVFLSSHIVVLAANPGRLAEIIEVPFAFPREGGLRVEPAYLALLARVTALLREVNPSPPV